LAVLPVLEPYAIGVVGGLIDGANRFSEVEATEKADRCTESKVLGDFGGGLEYRFTRHLGLFGETTYNVVDGPKKQFPSGQLGLSTPSSQSSQP
jgi:hypothetical protein